MKKTLSVLAALLVFGFLSAQDRYSLTLQGVYDYGTVHGHQGGVDIAGHLPFNPHFEADAAFEYMGPGICAGTVVARPKFPLKKGELFLEGALHLRAFGPSQIGNYTMAASFGYRMDYVSVQIGVESLTIFDMLKKMGDTRQSITEPVNLLFRLAFNVRPATSPWNINLGFGNFNLYQYERLYYPIFFLGGHYDFTEHLTVLAEANLKPSGMFNMTTHFNEIALRAGLKYNF